MADFDAETFAEQAVLIGLLTRFQIRDAQEEAEDGSLSALSKALLRKQFLTSWQVDRLAKGDAVGFFYGNCKVLFHIAEGTFARVYRGVRTPGNQPVAIKVLRQRFVTDPEAISRFNQEAEHGLKLVHPNIVRILDYGEQDKRHYMTMEYVEGSNLRDFLKLRHRLKPAEALPLMIGLAKGLTYSIEQGVTHRDIKATNILIGSSGVAKLVDFGLATLRDDSSKTAAAHGQRTIDYSALERTCNSPKGDPRSDIFFLGCVFYQMLTGSPPMAEVESEDMLAKMLKRSFGAIKPITEHNNAPPEGMGRIIERMMKVELRSRYQEMAQVVAELEAYQASADGVSGASTSSKSTKTRVIVDEFEDAFFRPEPAPDAASFRASLKSPAAASNAKAPAPAEPRPAAPRGPVIRPEDFDPEFEIGVYEPKHILCVEVQGAIQEAFRKTLSAMGYEVMMVRDAALAAERYREAPTDAVLFDADGQGPEVMDSFFDIHEKAHEDGHELNALVLLGPRQAALRSRLPTDDNLVVLVKPIKMKDVQEAVSQLVPLETA